MDCIAYDPPILRQTNFLDGYHVAPPHNRTDTSEVAAEQAAPKVSARMQTVLSLLKTRGPGGLTIDELSMITGLLVQSVCPVVNSLVKLGQVKDSGERRPTRSGSPAKVWIVADTVTGLGTDKEVRP